MRKRRDVWGKGNGLGEAQMVTGEVERMPSGIIYSIEEEDSSATSIIKDINDSDSYSPTVSVAPGGLKASVSISPYTIDSKPKCKCKHPEIEVGIMHNAQGRLTETYFCLVCSAEVDDDA